MKKSKAEAAQTRRRIVQTASEKFRDNGIDAIGLTELMAAAGLTHGGFYRHFESKAHLVAEACTVGMDPLIASCAAAASKGGGRDGLERFQSGGTCSSSAIAIQLSVGLMTVSCSWRRRVKPRRRYSAIAGALFENT